MRTALRTLVGIILPIIAIIVFTILLAFSLLRLSVVERDMRIEATQNMLWVISQAQVASLRLANATTKYTLGGLDRAELDLRYNVVLSRFALLNDGPQQRQMSLLGFDNALGQFPNVQRRLEEMIKTLQLGATDQADAINELLEPYSIMLTQAANKAMVAEWNDLGDKLSTSRNQVWQIIISLLGISLAGAFLSVHFLLSARAARQRAQQLEREKAFSELLIGSSGDGIIAVDLERRCTVSNEAAERLFGLTASQITGRRLKDVSGFFQIDRIHQTVSDGLSGHTTTLLDQPFFLTDHDEPLFIDLRCFPLRDGARIVGSILLITDVTERHAAQREIANHRDHLEQLVQERTKELDAALKRERATVDVYRNFGSMVSHQFRTPLSIMDSSLQRLIRRSNEITPEEVVERVDKARNAIARLVELVEGTLDAARLDAGQIEIQSHPFDLGHLTEDICARQKETTPEREINLIIDKNNPVITQCDPVHAEHVIVNMLTNAVKYSPDTKPITVEVRADESGAYCTITNFGKIECVIDQDQLFERYFRGPNAEGLPGIGIGLYMARALARMQGGDIQFEIINQDQISFSLTLPAQTEHIKELAIASGI